MFQEIAHLKEADHVRTIAPLEWTDELRCD